MAKRATVRRRVLKAAPREPFPVWPFLLLLATLFLFWVLPRLMGDRPVRVEFGAARR